MTIAEALAEMMGNQIDNIYYKSETTLPFKADLFLKTDFCAEAARTTSLPNTA